MELWQLRYFVIIAELQSIAQASAHLNIAAPAVSRAIKSPEDELKPLRRPRAEHYGHDAGQSGPSSIPMGI